METIIYFFAIIIIYFILDKVIDKGNNNNNRKKNCKAIYINIHTPDQMLTHYRKISDFSDNFIKTEIEKKEHDNGENIHEWLTYF
jgi:hypothetical protein